MEPPVRQDQAAPPHPQRRSATVQCVAQPRPQRRSATMKCTAMVLLGLLVLTGLIILTIYLAVQPKQLKYSIQHASVNGYALTYNGQLNADFHFVVRANNPKRRISLYYDKIGVTVSYEGHRVAMMNDFKPFYQPRRNVTQLEMDVVARGAVVNRTVASDLKREMGAKSVNLVVRMKVKLRLKVGPFRVHRKIRVLCGPMRVPIFGSSMGFERVLCDVDD